MGLFSTLLATNTGQAAGDADAGADAAASVPASLTLPTVIQMYAGKPFELEMKRASAPQIPSFAHLTYQAVPVDATEDPFVAAAPEPTTGLRAKSTTVVRVPALGVWNCRVKASRSQTEANSPPLGDALLAIPTKSASKHTRTFVWKVDLAQPELVEPTLVSLQDALVRYLIQSDDFSASQDEEKESSTATTTLFQLRSAQFGAPAEESGKDKNQDGTPDDRDRKIKVALQITAAWPSTKASDGAAEDEESEADSYRRKQTLALLYYHLRRYAASLNASLAFVHVERAKQLPEETEVNGQTASASMDKLQPTLNIPQLGAIWRALAEGKPVWTPEVWSEVLEIATTSAKSPDLENTGEGEEAAVPNEVESHTTALVYGPGTHSEDWIESVLLRNAQYPGHWDAAKDPLWKILPSPASNDAASSMSATASGTGDEFWLQELSNSVALPADTSAPAATPNKPTKGAADAKTPDVSDYFASLLKGK